MQKKKSREKRPPDVQVETSLQELSSRLREKGTNGHRIPTFDDTSLMENLHLTNAYYDKNIPGEPVTGKRPFSAFFKRVVRRLTAWYFEPAMDRQRVFNASVTRTINEMKQYLDHIQINEDIISTIMHRDLALFRANLLFLNKYIERRMVDFENELALARAVAPSKAAEAGGNGGDGGEAGHGMLAEIDVLTLEQRVHGSPRMVKDRQKVYLPYMMGCRDVLAVGCGRGELLQLLAQEGIPAKGTETNPTLVDYCKDMGLDVVLADPVEYLDSCVDRSLDGIVLSRFAGHEGPARLVRMLTLCRHKLVDGGPLIIETPNPFSLYAAASYALEAPAQAHPLHPETLKQLCVSYGFTDPTVMFLNPLPPEEHLEELELTTGAVLLDARQNELFHQINLNFGKLNRLIFSHRDYAVITRLGMMD